VSTDSGNRAVAGLNSEGEQTKRKAADRRRCLQIEEMGGNEASRYRAPRAVVQKQLVVHRSTTCQNALSFLRGAESGTNRS